MEWKLLGEEESVDINDSEIVDLAIDVQDEEETEVPVVAKPANARRAIEILMEQKQLEADTWDYFA